MIIISFMPLSEFAFERIGRMMAENGKNACAVGMNTKRPIFLCGTGINKKVKWALLSCPFYHYILCS